MEQTYWKISWCWERLKAGREGDGTASPTWWTWVWANFKRWRWTGKPGVLQSMGSQRVRHNGLKWRFTLSRTTLGLMWLIKPTPLMILFWLEDPPLKIRAEMNSVRIPWTRRRMISQRELWGLLPKEGGNLLGRHKEQNPFYLFFFPENLTIEPHKVVESLK